MKAKLLILSIFFAVMLTPLFSHDYLPAKVLAADENYIVHVGDSIQVPTRTLVHNSETKEVPGQIMFPDGSSKSGRSFIVTTPGAYQVVYRAYFGVEEEKETITYTCNRESGDFFTSNNAKNPATSGKYTYNTTLKSVQGAVLKLETKQVFTLNEVLDFNTFSSSNPFFEFIVDTSKQGESDLETLTIRLTDVEDSTNYVDITATDSGPVDDSGMGCYILAGASNQFKSGYEKWGDDYRVHINKYGTNVRSSFRALPEDNPAKAVQLFFDYPNKRLDVFPTYGAETRDKITDLDDESLYGSATWDGFKTGKAILSVFASSLSAESARIVVSRAGSVDLSQLVFEDHTAPVINIDYNGQNPSDLPKATLNKPYKIYSATVTDNYDVDLPYSVSVTYNDTVHGKEKDVSIIDGAFTPKQKGVYFINYRARDIYNNIGTKKVSITATDDSQTMTVSVSPTSMTQEAYSAFNLPAINDVVITGGAGRPNIVRSVVNSSGQEMPVSGNEFIPTEPGTYYAYYNAVDYIGNVASAKITLNVQPTSKPVFVGNPVLPRILIKGHTYTLPENQAAETVDGKSVLLGTEVYVNGALLSNRTFVASDTCKVKYKATGSTGTRETDEIVIPVIDGNNSQNQAAYFYGANISPLEEERGVVLSTSTNASTLFAGVLPYDTLYLSFTKDNSAANFEYLLFKFSEVNNPGLSLTFKVKFSGDDASISLLSGGPEHNLAYDLRDGLNVYSFSFSNVTKTLVDISHKTLTKVKVDDNGNPFNGFSGGLYLDISFGGVSGSSKLRMLELGNQLFGTNYFDAAPVVLFKERMLNEQDINTESKIPAVDVYDILGEASATISVRAPDGSFKLRDLDATQKHTFVLDAFGGYNVSYRAIDNSGNEEVYTRKITVYDNVAPTLTVKNKLKESYKINAKIKIPEYTVSDNSNSYTVNVFVILPNDEERILLKDVNGTVTSYLSKDSEIYNASFKVDDRTFKAEQYGTYRLRFVAYDDAYNKTVQEITFVVK